MIHYRSILVLALFLLSATAYAQPAEFLDVKVAVIRSLQENLQLKIEGITVLNAEEDITIRSSDFDTNFFASGTQRGSRGAGSRSFEGISSHSSLVRTGVSKFLNSGAEVQVTTNYARSSTGSSSQILNPAHTSDLSMSLRQPLLEGRGTEINLIPLQQAQIDARRAELFLKDSAIQQMEITEASYWDLAFAHEVQKVRTASKLHKNC
jgi:outer membrane protein